MTQEIVDKTESGNTNETEKEAKAAEDEKAKKEAEEKLKSVSSDQKELAKAIYKDIKDYKESGKYFNLTLIDSGFYSFTPKKSDGSTYKEQVLVDFVTEEVFVLSEHAKICGTLELTQTKEFDSKKDSKFTFLLKSNKEDFNKVKTTRSTERKKTLIKLDADRQKLIDDIEKLDLTLITYTITESPLKDYNQKYQEYLKAESEVELALAQRFKDFKNSLFFLKTTKSDSPAPAPDAGGAGGASPDAGGGGVDAAAAGEGAGGGGDADAPAVDAGYEETEKIKSRCQSQKNELTKKIQDFKKFLVSIDKNTLRQDLQDKIDVYDYFLNLVNEFLAAEGDEKLKDILKKELENTVDKLKKLLSTEKDFHDIIELVDCVKSMETTAIDEYKRIKLGKQGNLTYLAGIANYIARLIAFYDTISKESGEGAKEEKKDEEESKLLKVLNDFLKNIHGQSEEEVKSEGTETEKPREDSELDKLKKYFANFTPTAGRAGAEEEGEEEEGGGEGEVVEEVVESATTRKITKEELEKFKENFQKLKSIFSNTISSYSSKEEKIKSTEILQEIFKTTDEALRNLELSISKEEGLEDFLNQYDKADSKDEKSKEKLQGALKNLTDKKTKFDETANSFFSSDKEKAIVNTINELKYRYTQALRSSSALKSAIDQLKTKDLDKKNWQQALNPALFSDLETKFPVTDSLTIEDEITLITTPTAELTEKITAKKERSQEPVKLSDESKEITEAIKEKYNEDKQIKRHSWQGEKIFKVDNALQISLAVDFSIDSCFTVEERTLQKTSDPKYQLKKKEFYQIQDGLLYKASNDTAKKSNNKYLQAVTDYKELEGIKDYLYIETSLAKAANKKFQSIKNESSGHITLLRSDFIDKKYVKDDNYQKQYIKATYEDISLHGKEHKKSEFGSIHFIEQSVENPEQNYIFGKCNISYSSFRGCKFENVDFTLMDKKVFESLKFINCQFLNCKIPQYVNKAFATSNIAQKEIKVPDQTIEKVTVSALLANSKSNSTP